MFSRLCRLRCTGKLYLKTLLKEVFLTNSTENVPFLQSLFAVLIEGPLQRRNTT